LYQKYVNWSRQILIISEDLIHVIVALFLLLATGGVLIHTFSDFKDFSTHSILSLISNALLILIIKEVLWTVIKFLRRESFSVSSFLFIGIISSVRQILFLEVQKSFGGGHTDLMVHAQELLVNTVVILLLTIAYFLVVKADKIRKETKRMQ
jgi:uncharacterized membrane protein (DUF373 family)